MARVKRACPPPFAAKWYNPIVRAVSSHMTLISLSARTLSAASRIPKIFFWEILHGRFFQNAPGLLHPSPLPSPEFGRNSGGRFGRGISGQNYSSVNLSVPPSVRPQRRAPGGGASGAPPRFRPSGALLCAGRRPPPLAGHSPAHSSGSPAWRRLRRRGRAASDGDGRDATFPAGCAGAPPRTG